MVSIRDRLAALERSMTVSEQKITEALLDHKEPFLLAIGDLARLSHVSEATVVRFYRRLGFASYQELKVALAQEANQSAPSAVYEDVVMDDTPKQVLAKVIEQSVNALRTSHAMLDEEAFARGAQWVAEAQRLYFVGVGASGAIAQDAAHKFLRMGLTAVAVTDPHLQAIAACHMQPDDVVVAISHSGESISVLDAVRQAGEHTGRIIALTGYRSSSLAQLAPVSLVTAAREAFLRSDAMASRLVQLALLDALYVISVCRRGDAAIEAVNRSRLAVARLKT